MAKGKVKLVRVNNERHMVVTQVARLSFPKLFTASSFQDNPNERPEFSCDLIFDSMDDLKKPWAGKKTKTVSFLRAIKNVKVDQWGEDESKWPKFPFPLIRKGDDRKDAEGKVLDGYEGKFFVKVKSGEDYPPEIVLANGQPATKEDVYGGCFVQAQILCRPYTSPNPGVAGRIVRIKFVKDGEAFGAGADMMEYDENEETDDEDSEENDDF